MITLKNATIFILLSAAIALSVWSIFFSNSTTTTISKNATTGPDAIAEYVSATIFNKDGKVSLKVNAPKCMHYKENDSTNIFSPKIIVYRDSPQPWSIISDYAKAIHGMDQLNFWDHVVVHHLADSENPTTSLLTDFMTVYPDKKIAETDQLVTIIQPDSKIKAIGMLANLADNTIKFLSDVRGQYAPSA